MTDLCYELSTRAPGWTRHFWKPGEAVHTMDRDKTIDVHTRMWKSPSGKIFLEDAAYNVAFCVCGTKESDYRPLIPVRWGGEKSSRYIVNWTPRP